MKKTTDRSEALTRSAGPARATAEGTRRLAKRFEAGFAADFYRETTFGPTISSIGLGTYLGENTDEEDAAYVAAARHAIARGLNLLDTAINYRAQRSERALCVAIQEAIDAGEVSRDELVVCTKGGYVPLDRATPATREDYQAYVRREFIEPQIVQASEIVGGGHSLAPRFLRYCLAKSRQNLGLRSIDVYYVHNPEQQLGSVSSDELYTRLESAFAVLEEAADRGEISVYGVATWNGLRTAPHEPGHLSLAEVLAAARRAGGAEHRLRAVQLPINLAMSEGVRVPTQVVDGRPLTVLQAAAEFGLTVVGSASLMQARLASGLPPALREHFPTLRSDAQRALAFARTVEGSRASLVGMKKIAHVDENLNVGRG
jgi:aryl-alcohol dehydrogenase-like predicted oxidoreductase